MPGHRGALAAALVVILASVAAAWLRGGDGSVKRAEGLINWLEKITRNRPIWIGHHQKSSREEFVPHCSLLGDQREFVVAAERVVMPDGDVAPAASE